MDCRLFESHHCRSCELLDHAYSNTLSLKEKKLIDIFGGKKLHLKPTVALSEVEDSRNKAKLAVFQGQAGMEFGFYNAQMEFKTLEECPLHLAGINNLLPLLKEKLNTYKITPYSLESKKGELKYLVISKSRTTGEYLLRFTLRSKESLDRLRKMTAELEESALSVSVVTANIQPEHKAVIEGDEEIVLSQKNSIVHRFGDVTLTLGPRSFFQVTPEIAEALYKSAGDILREFNVSSLLDLYCGVGAFSYFAAQNSPDVLGVEISKEAIECALQSVKENKVKGQIDFKALDVEEFLKNLERSFDGILVNPPRRGLNSSIIKSIMKQKPRVVMYSSCNVETLARDFSQFVTEYEIASTQIFDMFPYTEHFETLMVMTRKDA